MQHNKKELKEIKTRVSVKSGVPFESIELYRVSKISTWEGGPTLEVDFTDLRSKTARTVKI